MENWRLIGSDRKFFKISPLEVKRKGGAAMLSCAKAISATPLDDYKVAIVFNNGQRGIFDCKYLIDYAISAPLADYSLFNQVRVEHGTLCWPNDIDVAPEAVGGMGRIEKAVRLGTITLNPARCSSCATSSGFDSTLRRYRGFRARCARNPRLFMYRPVGAFLRTRGSASLSMLCGGWSGGNVKFRRYGLGALPERHLACAGL